MAEIDDIIKKLFEENPGISDDDIEKRLSEEKDPFRLGNPRWRASYIQRRLREYHSVANGKPIAPIDASQDIAPEIEGKEIKKHPDIFSPRKEYKPDMESAKSDLQTIEKLNLLSDKLEGMNNDLSGIVKIVSDIDRRVSLLQKMQTRIEPKEIEYAEIVLRKDTVTALKHICGERKIDESDYIDILLAIEQAQPDKHDANQIESLKSLIKEDGGELCCELKFDEASGKITVEKKPKRRFGISLKSLLVGIGIGAIVGIIITVLLFVTKVVQF